MHGRAQRAEPAPAVPFAASADIDAVAARAAAGKEVSARFLPDDRPGTCARWAP